MPVVLKSGTFVPPGEQMSGKMMLAIFMPIQMTSTPSGKVIKASKAGQTGQSKRLQAVLRARTTGVNERSSELDGEAVVCDIRDIAARESELRVVDNLLHNWHDSRSAATRR